MILCVTVGGFCGSIGRGGEVRGAGFVRHGREGDSMRMVSLLAGGLLVMGCVSRGAYRKRGESLERSLELNAKCIDTVKRLEAENKAFRGIYGDVKKGLREAEKGILDGTRVK